jgi:hypothetical protein
VKCRKCLQHITPEIGCECIGAHEDLGYTKPVPKQEREQRRKGYGAEKAKRSIDDIKDMLGE